MDKPPGDIRVADTGDAPRLAVIDAAVSSSPCSESRFKRICSPSADSPLAERALVWVASSQIEGFVVVSQVLDEANINNIAVSPASQGRGVGSVLLQAAIDHLAGQGASRCMLEVRESNLAARALYNQFGFVLDGVRRAYYRAEQGREDALLMSRSV